jgi:hypothetical protein
VKLRPAAAAASLFVGLAAWLAVPAGAALDNHRVSRVDPDAARAAPLFADKMPLDPKCVKAFDMLMEACDDRDIGVEEDWARTGDDSSDVRAGEDEGDAPGESRYDDGYRIVVYRR